MNYFLRTQWFLKTKPLNKFTKDSERTEEDMVEKETVVIFTATKARQLLKKGFQIVDIKPDKQDPEHKRTVFVFKNEDGLLADET